MTKFNRPSRFDDVLFAIAVLVPVVCAMARFADDERKANVIAQAQQKGTESSAAAPVAALVAVAGLTRAAH